MKNSKLTNGLIPKNEICPFVEKCGLKCFARKAETNPLGLSCAMARGFDMANENPDGAFASMVKVAHDKMERQGTPSL